MKKFCKYLRKYVIKLIDCEEKQMIPLTDEVVLIVMMNKIIKTEIIVILLVNIEVLLIIILI